MIENKRNLDKIETEVHKKPRDATLSLEIPWVSVVEWKEQLSGLNDLVSFPDKVAKMKETMVTRVQKIKIDGKVHEFAGHVLWLDIAEDIPVYVVLENSINKSFFDQKITREEILGLSREGVDVTIYSHAQNTFIESGQTDNDLRIKLKANMARKSRPLLSLKWDGRGDVLEVVWLQASGGFDDYVAINGRVLQSLLTLFAELFPPRRMTILADQAKSGNLLIRKFYPFIKDVYHCGPGYYGNWGFVPADCWGVQDVDGNVIFQSRELYYSAVEFLRNIPLKELNLNFDDTMEGETLHSVLKIACKSFQCRDLSVL